jgi:hypothetical protein
MVQELPRSSSTAFAVIREILSLGWIDIPEQYRGTGAPGNTLEYLVDIEENNFDSPDLKDWELKFHGGSSSLVTLFHKDPEPRGILNTVVNEFGWPDNKGNISFRHTISGKTERGFYVVNENNKILIKNDSDLKIVPFWEHNTLLGQFGAKLRRLIVVHGHINKHKRQVIYEKAVAYWDIDIINFCKAVENGIVFVDFDARTTKGRNTPLRNHGTKFRIKISDIELLYKNNQVIDHI